MTVKTTISNGDAALDVRDTLNNALVNITSHGTAISSNTTDITGLKSRMTTAEATILTHTSTLGTATTNITGLTNRMGVAEGTISTNTSNITALTTTVSGHTTAITALQNGSNYVTVSTKTAAYTLVASDTSDMLIVNVANGVNVTLPNSLAVGFQCSVLQAGAGQITFVPATGATLANRQGFTKTAAQNAVVTLMVVSNSGSNAAYVLVGDGA